MQLTDSQFIVGAMVIQHLAYLAALAREGHFKCCGELPRLAADASAGIRRLEAEFGVSPVQRGQRFEGLHARGRAVLVWAH